MPLKKGSSKKTMSANYRKLKREKPGMSRKQKVAIMLSVAGKSKGKTRKGAK